MNIVVIGANGLLGSTLVPVLEQNGHKVIVPPREGSQIFDLLVPSSVTTFLDTYQPHIIINLAALTNVDVCEENRELAFALNAKAVGHLCEWTQKQKSSHLIQISTDMVYDSNSENKESDVTPINIYSLTKYAGDLLAVAGSATVLRTNFFGPSLNPNRQSFSDWLIQAMQKKTPIKLLQDVFFSPLCLQTLTKMIQHVVQSPQPGIFNLGSHEGMSKAEFAYMLSQKMDFSIESHSQPVHLQELGLKAPRPLGMKMDVSLFEKTFKVQLPKLKDEIHSVVLNDQTLLSKEF